MKRACAECGVTRDAGPTCKPEGQYRCQPCRRTQREAQTAQAIEDRRKREQQRQSDRLLGRLSTCRPCTVCGTMRITTGASRREVICQPCRRQAKGKPAHLERRPSRPPEPRPKIACTDCGRPRPTSRNSNPIGGLICLPCRRKRGGIGANGQTLEERRDRNREYQRKRRRAGKAISPGNHRTRAKRLGVEYEYVDRLRVYRRDKWRCGICHEKVDKRLKWPDPGAATLDHIIPMSQGGGHTYANTHCAHWQCNQHKHMTGGGEQLALIG